MKTENLSIVFSREVEIKTAEDYEEKSGGGWKCNEIQMYTVIGGGEGHVANFQTTIFFVLAIFRVRRTVIIFIGIIS